jgi:hypothetical protein
MCLFGGEVKSYFLFEMLHHLGLPGSHFRGCSQLCPIDANTQSESVLVLA